MTICYVMINYKQYCHEYCCYYYYYHQQQQYVYYQQQQQQQALAPPSEYLSLNSGRALDPLHFIRIFNPKHPRADPEPSALSRPWRLPSADDYCYEQHQCQYDYCDQYYYQCYYQQYQQQQQYVYYHYYYQQQQYQKQQQQQQQAQKPAELVIPVDYEKDRV